MPAVNNVSGKVPTPLIKVEFAGRTAEPSLLMKCTVPAYAVAVLLAASCAVTVQLNALPTVSGEAADTMKCVAAPGFTTIVPEVPTIEAVTVSVAVMAWLPGIFRVAENVPAPLVKAEFAGSVAAASLLVKCIVPAYPVAVLLLASRAVTVKLNALPAVSGDAADTMK